MKVKVTAHNGDVHSFTNARVHVSRTGWLYVESAEDFSKLSTWAHGSWKALELDT